MKRMTPNDTPKQILRFRRVDALNEIKPSGAITFGVEQAKMQNSRSDQQSGP